MPEAPIVSRAKRTTYVVSERLAVQIGDIAEIRGVAGKVGRLKRVRVSRPSIAQVAFSISKRSAASTVGTPTTPTTVPLDSGSAAAVLTARGFTVAPTPGAAVGTIYGGVPIATTETLEITFGADDREDVTIRAGEAIALVTDTAATLTWLLEWTETTY